MRGLPFSSPEGLKTPRQGRCPSDKGAGSDSPRGRKRLCPRGFVFAILFLARLRRLFAVWSIVCCRWADGRQTSQMFYCLNIRLFPSFIICGPDAVFRAFARADRTGGGRDYSRIVICRMGLFYTVHAGLSSRDPGSDSEDLGGDFPVPHHFHLKQVLAQTLEPIPQLDVAHRFSQA